jgi:VCBS repeat-containing protein
MTIEGRNDAPVFVGLPTNFDVLENTTAVGTVAGSDVDVGTTLAFSIAGGADAGLFTIDATTGALAFLSAPDFEAPGDVGGNNVYDLILGVSDGAVTTEQAVTVTVTDVNEGAAATVAIAASADAPEGDSGTRNVTFTVTRTGATANAVTVSLAAFGTAVAASDFTGTIPASVVIGAGETETSFIVSVTGDIDPEADETIRVEITGLDRADHAVTTLSATHTILNDDADPVAVADSGVGFVTDEDNVFTTASVLANDSDPDGDLPLSVLSIDTTGLLGTLTDNGNGTFGYDPNGAFEALGAGEFALDSFTYTVSDAAGATDTATVTIRVNGVNDAPTLVGTTAAATEDGLAVDIALAPLGDDADAEDDGTTLSYAIVSQPAEGTASILGTTLTFDPGAAFQDLAEGETRQVVVQVQATDAQLAVSTIADVVVTVTGVNDAPVFVGLPAAFNVAENTTAVGTVAGADADADTTLAFSIAGGADAGRFTIDAATGALAFLSAPDFEVPGDADDNNVYDLILGVSDGTVTTEQAVTVTVTDVNEGGGNLAPVAVDDAYTMDDGDMLTVAAGAGLLANDSDPDGDPIQVVSFQQGTNGTVNVAADGSFTYTPNAGFVGTETVLYTISDGTAFATASLTVTVENDPPVAVDDAYTMDDGGVLTVAAGLGLLANDSDPDGDSIQVIAFQQGTNGIFDVAADGSFTYTPNAGFVGTETVLYTISDGTAFANAFLTVTVENDPPVAVDDAFTTDEDTAIGAGLNLFADNGAGPDSDPDGDALTVTAVNGVAASVGSQIALASGALLTVNADGTFDYDPNGAFEALNTGEFGSDSFVYTVSDGVEEASATATIAIAGVTDGGGLNLVLGTSGSDFVTGTDGADLIRSLDGRLDIIEGLGGADVFDFSDIVGNGVRETRTVLDYTVGEDAIALGTGIVSAFVEQTDQVRLLIDGDRDVITLRGVSDYDDIAFV